LIVVILTLSRYEHCGSDTENKTSRLQMKLLVAERRDGDLIFKQLARKLELESAAKASAIQPQAQNKASHD
jgi:hypothetical protein